MRKIEYGLSQREKELLLEYRAGKVIKAWQPKPKAEFSTEEKVAFFDETYDSALAVLREQEINGRYDEKEEYWAFERMMSLLGKGFWEYFNSLDGGWVKEDL